MRIEAHGISQKGKAHKENEDYFLINKNKRLFAVADGVTTIEFSYYASRNACKYLDKFFNGNLNKTILEVNEKIFKERKTKKIGLTTLTAAYIKDFSLEIGHIGDSAAFIIRKGNIKEITMPDSILGTSTLIQVVGQERIVPHNYKVKLEHGNIIILATDGVSNTLGAKGISKVASFNKNLEMIAKNLIEEANKKPKIYDDDKTVIVIRVKK